MFLQLIGCSGHDQRITDYENMEGSDFHYQVSGLKETRQEEQEANADYEPMRGYMDVIS